jgi:ATP-binding cassette subfamily C protein CydD
MLRNVRFRYATGTADIFNSFNLDIEPGEHVALLAPSGYGKSTLLALIAGLAAPQEGEVRVGNIALSDETAAAIRTRMSWVGQKPHIFAGSARYNISLGRDADVMKTSSIINQMALSHVVGVTGSGVIGENGAGLSGGEALRLALARIAVDDHADIILADEPTAHLDQETAGRIAGSLVSLAKGKTLIISTHDEKLASRMDRIVRLDDLSANAQLWQKRAAE